jgi:aryl-alcohol dehydrogenase-like predicted oxidoreductase
MDSTRLGAQGPLVSRLGLGTAQFGTRLGRKEAERLVDMFVAQGGTMLDTADVYGRGDLRHGPGASERLLGDILRSRRREVFIASKVGQAASSNPGSDEVGLSPIRIRRGIDRTLRHLRTDWIDLYQCHLWDPNTPLEDTIGALSDLVAEGKIRYIGVSNWDGWQVVAGAWKASDLSKLPIVSDQLWYNLLDRKLENAVIPACNEIGVAVVAYGALAQGFLTGGYDRSSSRESAGGRFAVDGLLRDLSWAGLATARGWRIVDAVRRVAELLGLSPSIVSLRWLLEAGRADVILLGPRSTDQLAEFLRVSDVELPLEARDRLTQLSQPEATYPGSFTDAYSRPQSPYYGGMVEHPAEASRRRGIGQDLARHVGHSSSPGVKREG